MPNPFGDSLANPFGDSLANPFGDSLANDDRNIVSRTISPRKEKIGEASPLFRGLSSEDALNFARGQSKGPMSLRNPDQNAELSKDRFGNETIILHGEELYLNTPGFTVNDIPDAVRKVDETVKDVAPFIAGGVVAAPLNAAKASLVQGATGLASETAKQVGEVLKGKGFDESKLLTTPLFAIGGELAGRAAFAVMAPVFSKILGKAPNFKIINEDGSLTDDAIARLADSGVDASQIDDLARAELSTMQKSGVLTKEQAERFNFFNKQGIKATKAQITRNADDFQIQQEAAKTSTSVREALETQDDVISRAFDTQIRGTGGNANSSGSPVADAVLNKASTLDAEISALYRSARESAPEAKIIRLDKLVAQLRNKAPSNEAANGLINSIRGDLKARGIIDDSFKVVGRVSVDTAEEVRKVINSHHSSTSDFGRALMRQFKNSLDDDVLSTFGDDLFAQARSAKANFESGLSVERLSKFDANKRSLVRDVLENKIKPDDLFDRAVLGKTWKASDLRQLKTYLTRGSQEQVQAGAQAWDDLRAETIQTIKDAAFKGPIDEAGNQVLSRDALERITNKIGAERLGVLFNGEERKFLSDMARLAQLREPVRGTALGKGPTAQAIKSLEDRAKRLPIVGSLLDFVDFDVAGKAALKTTEATQRALSSNPASRAFVAPGAATGVVVEDNL
jgi:hypothetical protein